MAKGSVATNVVLKNDEIVVLQAQLGEWDNLNHLLVCLETRTAVIIDPFDAKFWFEVCSENGWELEQAWLTHSHWDHAKGIEDCMSFGGPNFEVILHSKELERGWEGPHTHLLTNPEFSAHKLSIGKLEFEAHCTPGHTPGHLTFIGNGVVISGDCLFLGRCGRADLYGGDVSKLRDSLTYLRNKITSLEENLVLPGHQYQLDDGSSPTFLSVADLLSTNEAILALDDDEKWNNLDFLAFEDSLAEKARRQRAMDS